ncbi:UPF0187 domain membrane protein [Cordyceps fumosorosea ARSEF 2679]|uniref:UPF0187 domain membrane protein n=1 Tax=Cordyceps fumosorosea (strain ARSEF 2679) TaxID=1081104 RepID=A0A168D989_CORFA|nr:UPF0187 domain membrane protein [Cordyceps fumosorosea ARSEF 2679]OAA72315.1 UPF0187 domain membrane protein [Cordyceps fumosorosea ARSEF 2679]
MNDYSNYPDFNHPDTTTTDQHRIGNMSDGGADHGPPPPPPPLTMPKPDATASRAMTGDTLTRDDILSPTLPFSSFPPSSFQRHGPQHIDDYFTGPRDLSRHSKWPVFLQMHGSILPKMILPLFFVGAWATAVTVVSETTHSLGVNSVLLTITGFVVGMGLSFRSSTAYERYQEGRKYWTALITSSQNLGRIFWIHAKDHRADQDPRETILAKLSAMNLLVAFAVALKHTLRFEPYTDYDDLQHLIGHLDTFARAATEDVGGSSVAAGASKRKNLFKSVGEYLGVSFAASNPRKTLKRTTRPLGNLPLEIMNHLASAVDELVANQQLTVPMQQTLAYNNLNVLGDVLAGCERILNTPLPIAYSIAISQITWVYVMLLPFQLVNLLHYVAIPATIAAAYIILGLLLIGREIENPFGQDVNDLPLECFCEQVTTELDIIASFEKKPTAAVFNKDTNFPLYPVSTAPASIWLQRSEQKLRHTIRSKPNVTFDWKNARGGEKVVGDRNV